MNTTYTCDNKSLSYNKTVSDKSLRRKSKTHFIFKNFFSQIEWFKSNVEKDF